MSDYYIEVLPGGLAYRSVDGRTQHWPGPDPWTPVGSVPMDDLDLMNLRAKCVQTLRKVEDALEARGILGRITSGGAA